MKRLGYAIKPRGFVITGIPMTIAFPEIPNSTNPQNPVSALCEDQVREKLFGPVRRIVDAHLNTIYDEAFESCGNK